MMDIADCQLPIANLKMDDSRQLAIGNRKLAMKRLAMKKSRAKQRGTSNRDLKFSGLAFRLPELFSWLFYVAASRLNSPRFSSALYAS
jgi:hypothetical protein